MLRIGAAGSLTMLVGESAFFVIDGINTRTKMINGNIPLKDMFKKVTKNEGYMGLFKGYSAAFYSSILSGFIYFYVYKLSKIYLKDNYSPKNAAHYAGIYALASSIAEIFVIFIYYPFELVKVRLQTKNHLYRYQNLFDAFVKIIQKD